MREADRALVATTFLTGKGRLAWALLELATLIGEESESGAIVLKHRVNQSDLAAMAGVARENVSSMMSDWRKRNLLVHSSQYYRINDVAALVREIKVEE